MELKKISISGFCNIEKFDIAFSEFNALVAPNNYGKSNVLEGIRFAFRFMAATESERNAMMRDAAFRSLTPQVYQKRLHTPLC